MKYRLGDICLINEQSYSTKDDYKFANYLDTGNITKNFISQIQYIDLSSTKLPSRAKRIVRRNDIIYSTVRPNQEHYGFIKNIPNNFLVSTGFAVLTPNQEKVSPYWLYCYLTQKTITNQMQLIAEQNVSTYPSIRPENLAGIELNLPDSETQRKIVRIISALDQKIELNNKINDNILHISHQIYLNDIKGVTATRTEKLGKLCNIKYGKGLPTSKILEKGFRVYGGNGIIGFYDEKMYYKSQVLISCRGAASGKVIFTRPDCFVTNNSLILECENKYHYFVKEFSLDREYYDYTTGSAQPQITIDNIKDIELSVPDDEVLAKFNAMLQPLEEKYFTILDENEILVKARDILLPKLMSGEINVEKVKL